jgi:hypothetical protein
MSPTWAATAAFLVGAALSTVLTLLVLGARANRRYAVLPSFRCRLGPPTARWRRRRARWCRRRTRAAWVDGVLLVRSGAMRQSLTPLSASVAGHVDLRALTAGEVRGLGAHPVVLRLAGPMGGPVEIAAAAEDAERLTGPFVVASLSVLPGARGERGA